MTAASANDKLKDGILEAIPGLNVVQTAGKISRYFRNNSAGSENVSLPELLRNGAIGLSSVTSFGALAVGGVAAAVGAAPLAASALTVAGVTVAFNAVVGGLRALTSKVSEDVAVNLGNKVFDGALHASWREFEDPNFKLPTY